MIQVVLHYIILVDTAENKGDVIQDDQVLYGNLENLAFLLSFAGIQKWIIAVDKKNIPFDGRESYLIFAWSKTMWFEALDWPWTKTHMPSILNPYWLLESWGAGNLVTIIGTC